MEATHTVYYRSKLLECFTEKQAKNPAFSLRAYARLLGTSPSTLSEIMSGKRGLSRKLTRQFSDRLLLTFEQQQRFFSSSLENSTHQKSRKAYIPNYTQLELRKFNSISKWYHYGILSLSQLPDCEADPKWIAKRLGISVAQARDAFENLEGLELIRRVGRKYVQTSESIYFSSPEIKSRAIQNYHHSILEVADISLRKVPVELRDFSAITLAMDPEQLKKASSLIRRFRRRLAAILEKGDKTAVYTMSIQLFPLTQITKSGRKQ